MSASSGDPGSLRAINVRSSRLLGLPAASAIGGTLTTGLGVFLLLGTLFRTSGTATPSAYVLSVVFFLPIVLSLAESALLPGDPGGLFHMARVRNRLRSSFLIGWLLLGGLGLLGSTLSVGVGAHLARLARIFFEVDLPATWLALPAILLVMLNQWPRSQVSWGRRGAFLFAAIAGLLALLAWASLSKPEAIRGYAFVPSRDPVDSLPQLTLGLWGLHFILEHRRYLRGRPWQALSALIGAVVIGAVAGWAAASTILGFPVLLAGDLPLIDLAAVAGPVWEVLALTVVILLAGSALDIVFASGLRLAAEMAMTRFLPRSAAPTLAGRTAGRPLLLLALLMAVAGLMLPSSAVIGGASFAIAGALAILLLPQSLRRPPERTVDRPLLLPLYPLFPAAAVVVCVVVLLTLPAPTIVLMFGWLAAGSLYFILRARREAIELRQQQEIIGDRRPAPEPDGYRLLVGVANPATATVLLRAGAAVARARDGTLLALRVVEAAEQMPSVERHRQARKAWDELQEWLREADLDPGVRLRPLVRFAPTVGEGLQATLWEESVDSLLLGWPVRDSPRLVQVENTIDQMVGAASCEVLVVRGDLPRSYRRILVPLTSDAHSPAALKLARDLAHETIVALRPVAEPISEARHHQLILDVRQDLEKNGLDESVEVQVVVAPDTRRGILQAATDADLVILGVSEEGFLAPTGVRGLPQAVAEGMAGPLLLIKRREIVHQFWLRRAWEQLYASLPTLGRDQQAAVGLGMRQSARAGIDYYVLVVLSSCLALLGLLQNSSAVIIGAMLVAPLMSPILGIAHGVVRGDERVIRVAANSTLNGVVLAIALPAGLSLILPGLGFRAAPTAEILARTQPAVIDLLVAFISGLAGAYAVSRADVAAALPGVAIAAALVPPLAVVGYGLGTAEFGYASGALLLFLTNLASIVLAGTVMFLLLGIRPPLRVERGERAREALRWIAVAIVVVSIPLVLSSAGTSRRDALQARAEEVVAGFWDPASVTLVEVAVDAGAEGIEVHLTVFDHGHALSAENMGSLANALSRSLGEPVTVDYRIIPADAGAIRSATATPPPTPTATVTALPSPTATAAGSE